MSLSFDSSERAAEAIIVVVSNACAIIVGVTCFFSLIKRRRLSLVSIIVFGFVWCF